MRLGKGDGRVRHALLVVGPPGGESFPHGVERFAQAGHIAVAEDGEYAGKERRRALRIGPYPLCGQELHQRLGHGQANDLCHQSALDVCQARIRPR